MKRAVFLAVAGAIAIALAMLLGRLKSEGARNMTKLAEIFRRIPRIWLFAVAGVIQVVLIALMVADRVRILRMRDRGDAQDPRDRSARSPARRLCHARLRHFVSRRARSRVRQAAGRVRSLYVKLAPDPDGFYKAVSLHRELVPVAPGEVHDPRPRPLGRQLRAGNGDHFARRSNSTTASRNFFVPQGEGREIEKARNQGKVAIVAAVTSGGRAAIKRLVARWQAGLR